MPQMPHRLDRLISKRVELDYLLHIPDGYDSDPAFRWPLVLFLHGARERGSHVADVARHGVPRMAQRRPELLPFVAVSPQCPADAVWDDLLDGLLALLDDIATGMRIDPDRVYLTGLSMGGYGAWHLACLYPDRFAALAPICGGGMPMRGYPARVTALRQMPVWAFHGALDPIVPVDESRRMVDALRAAGGQPRLTVYPAAGHDVWTRTYEDPEFYSWLLSQARSPS